MIKGARFSECGKYRYQLYRLWDNADTDDPTIESLIRILTNQGYGGFYMMNLFALVSPNPEDLRMCPDPVKDNDEWILKTQQWCRDVIFCWGNFPMAGYRAKHISRLFPYAKCFGKNMHGTPKHPLYLKATVQLQNFYNH